MFSDPLSFLLLLDELPDPRQDAKVLYPLPEMIFLAMCGAVANCDTWTNIQQCTTVMNSSFGTTCP